MMSHMKTEDVLTQTHHNVLLYALFNEGISAVFEYVVCVR